MISLCDIKINQKAIILNVLECDLKNRLIDLGFVNDTIVEPVLVSPFNDPVAYKIRGSIIALRNEDAINIKVRCLDE